MDINCPTGFDPTTESVYLQNLFEDFDFNLDGLVSFPFDEHGMEPSSTDLGIHLPTVFLSPCPSPTGHFGLGNGDVIEDNEPGPSSMQNKFVTNTVGVEGHIPHAVPVSPPRVVVKDQVGVYNSAMALGIDPAKIVVDEKLLNKKDEVKKRKDKKIISPEEKTAEYYARRAKNTEAARRSRDKRRVKENEMILQTIYLEEKYLRLQKQYQELMDQKIEKMNQRRIA